MKFSLAVFTVLLAQLASVQALAPNVPAAGVKRELAARDPAPQESGPPIIAETKAATTVSGQSVPSPSSSNRPSDDNHDDHDDHDHDHDANDDHDHDGDGKPDHDDDDHPSSSGAGGSSTGSSAGAQTSAPSGNNAGSATGSAAASSTAGSGAGMRAGVSGSLMVAGAIVAYLL